MINPSTKTGPQFSYLLLTLALTVFAVAPLTYPGYIQVHDGFLPVYNLTHMAGAPLKTAWMPGFVTGFDPLRSDGPLPYYLALPIVWLGGTPLNGIKIVFALSFWLGAAGVYLWLRRPMGPAGAALAALVYTYLPYHIAAVYARGTLGEALFLGVLPWAMLTATSFRRSRLTSPSHILTAVVWVLLGLSQAGLAIWGFVLCVAWLLLVDQPQRGGQASWLPYRSILASLVGSAIGLILVFLISGFWLPNSPIDFFDHFLYPAQLFSAYWGFGASRPGWGDGLGLGLGLAAVGLGIVSLSLAFSRRRTGLGVFSPDESPLSSPNPLTLTVLALALTLLLLAPTAALWKLTALYRTLTYPWQLLGPIGLLLSALAGAAPQLDRRLSALPGYAALLILTLLASYSYLEPRFTQLTPAAGPLAAWDSHSLMLLDYDLSVEIPSAAAGLGESTPGRLPLTDYGPPRPGDTLHVTLTWQATRPFYKDLKLFLHLMDASGQVIAQQDPLAGAGAGLEESDYFTSRWDPGQLILDDVALSLPLEPPPGPYRLALGLYDAETLERLPIVGQEDARVILELGSSPQLSWGEE